MMNTASMPAAIMVGVSHCGARLSRYHERRGEMGCRRAQTDVKRTVRRGLLRASEVFAAPVASRPCGVLSARR